MLRYLTCLKPNLLAYSGANIVTVIVIITIVIIIIMNMLLNPLLVRLNT